MAPDTTRVPRSADHAASRSLPADIASLLTRAADRAPERAAIVDQGRAWSWAEVDARAGRMAAALLGAGIDRGDRVGVHFRKSADAFCAMHAAVRIGAVAVPLDPTASATYLSQVCRLAGCNVLLTHAPCASSAHRLAAEAELSSVIGLDAPADELADTAAGPPGTEVRWVPPDVLDDLEPVGPVAVAPTDLSYLITTSGSTGTPKSICHTHASAVGHVRSMLAFFDFGADDRFADIAPNHFDISTPALWLVPAVGATNVVVPEPYQMLPASAAQLAETERITVWYSVPYLLTQLLQRGGLAERDLSSLRHVLFGGEVFPPGALAELMALLPEASFSNVYGPAEVNMCTVHRFDGPPADDEPVPIGVPPPETRIRLTRIGPAPGTEGATSALGEVAAGEQGEIWVSGQTTMEGYWKRPDETARAFVDDASGRWYRTGDMGRRRADGVLVFEGRLDHQVKVRGHRIELESIEAVLEDVPGVAYAVAAVARAEDGGDELVAGVGLAAGASVDWAELPTRLANDLAGYAIPRTILTLNSAPTTGSGKLDRRALRTAVVERFSKGD